MIAMNDLVGRAFVGLGLKKDDKIAIISNNRPEWNFIDYGAMKAGLINVPVYPTISEDDYLFICHFHSEMLYILRIEEQ